MVQVYSASDPADAQLIRGLLEDNGIPAVLQGESLWAARGGLPVTPGTAPSVWVNEADAEAARVVLEQYRKRPRPHAPAWRCPTCGHEIEGQFSECWRCGGIPKHTPSGEG